MADLTERYVREIHESLRYWPTWAPGVELRLGDCGPVEDWVFRPERNVRDFGIEFEIDRGSATMPWSHTSEHSLKTSFQLAGEAQTIPEVPQGSAGIKLAFQRERAIVFAAVDGREDRIRDILELKRQVLGKAQSGEFPDNYVVVTNLVTAASATVLISEDAGGSFTASAQADFKAGVVDIGNASLGVTPRVTDKVRTELVAKTGVTPLFNAFKLRRNWWQDVRAETLDAADEQALPVDELTPATV